MFIQTLRWLLSQSETAALRKISVCYSFSAVYYTTKSNMTERLETRRLVYCCVYREALFSLH